MQLRQLVLPLEVNLKDIGVSVRMNTYIYCITECGGPMERASCPECRVVIGGENHRHAAAYTAASEIDGARNLMFQQHFNN